MGENLRVFFISPGGQWGTLNLCAVVWTVFYRWQECLYRGETYREVVEGRTVFVWETEREKSARLSTGENKPLFHGRRTPQCCLPACSVSGHSCVDGPKHAGSGAFGTSSPVHVCGLSPQS